MAIEMKQLMMAVIVIVCVICTHIHFVAADAEAVTVWSDCGNTEYRNGSAFQRNLNKLLESLVRNVNPSGFNMSSIVVDSGENSNSSVYGFVQCRGDLDSSDCKQCASTAKANLVQACHNTSGMIQLDGCFLRYDNHSFYSDDVNTKSQPISVLCNTGNSSQPEKFTNVVRALLLNVSAKAVESSKFFALDSIASPSNSTKNIYSLALCWRFLSRTDCGSCLTSPFEDIFLCQSGALGAQFGSQNCYLRYEVYEFFNASVLSPSPAESPRSSPGISFTREAKRPRVLWMSLSAVAGTIILIATIGLWKWKFCYPEAIYRTRGEEENSIIMPTIANPELIFKFNVLREATSNFKEDNKLGEGGFGCVFKGVLPDGREVAIKRLYMGTRHADAEFLNEANLISRVQHRNLVKLLGCSVQGSERLLVYEYLQKSSLDKILFDATKCHLLDWKDRYEIIVGTARGLSYLHQESHIRVIHRDIKASNILLDDKNRPKIADFGLARLFAEDQSHVSTRVAGTLGYMAPEYALHGQLTEKADVFSFGVLVLEIISGRKNRSSTEDMEFLIQGTWRLYKEDRALEMVEPTLEGSYSWEEGIRVITIGLLCTQAAAALRPSMFRVMLMLTSEREHLPSPTRPAFVDVDTVPPIIHSVAADPSLGTLEPR